MLWPDMDDEPPSPGGDQKNFITAAFLVPLDKKAPIPTIEEWARRGKVEWLHHEQYSSHFKKSVADGLWGGNVYCQFYVAILQEHTCIMIAPFHTNVRKLVHNDDISTNLKDPPTWPLLQLFRDTCLSLSAEFMIFSYQFEHANLRWVQKEYPYLLKRDPWLLMERGEYGLLYMNGAVRQYMMPEFEGDGDRDYIDVEGGGILVFAHHGRDRWCNPPGI